MNILGIDYIDGLIYKHLHQSYMKDLKKQLNFDENSKQLKGMRFAYPYDKNTKKYWTEPQNHLEYYIVKTIDPNYNTKLHKLLKQNEPVFIYFFIKYFIINVKHTMNNMAVDIEDQESFLAVLTNILQIFLIESEFINEVCLCIMADPDAKKSMYFVKAVSEFCSHTHYIGEFARNIGNTSLPHTFRMFLDFVNVKYKPISKYEREYRITWLDLTYNTLGKHRPNDYPVVFNNKKKILEELEMYPDL